MRSPREDFRYQSFSHLLPFPLPKAQERALFSFCLGLQFRPRPHHTEVDICFVFLWWTIESWAGSAWILYLYICDFAFVFLYLLVYVESWPRSARSTEESSDRNREGSSLLPTHLLLPSCPHFSPPFRSASRVPLVPPCPKISLGKFWFCPKLAPKPGIGPHPFTM